MSDATQNPPTPDEPSRSASSSPPPPPGAGSYQPAPPGQPMSSSGEAGQPADLLNRFLARLIDFVLLAVVAAVINSVILSAIFATSGAGMLGVSSGTAFGYAAVSSLVTAALYLGYFALMEARSGQTLGKMVVKLQTQGPNGGTPTMEQALRRNAFVALNLIGIVPIVGWILGPLVSLAAVIMIAVTISNNPATRQGWHDNFAGGTSVVKVG